MKCLNKFLTLFVIFIISCTSKCITLRHERFEYKYSFKGPYLAQKDGSVPFWSYHGNAIASEEMVRIAPSLKSKRGSIWSKLPTTFNWWEIELWFRIVGRGRLGADGLAFFYTSNPLLEGPVFGSADKWNGLAIFFDSFDNDGKENNPFIMAMVNNGTLTYNHDMDGSNQKLASCLRDFRNKPYPVKAKIEYYQNILRLYFHSGNTNNDDEYEMCFETTKIFLPTSGYFGLSAATGDLADDHDALKFLTYSLYEPGIIQVTNVDNQEQEKYSKEYENYKLKLDKQKDDYLKEHPNEAPKFKNEPESEYESLGEREFLQILSTQNQVHEILKGLNHKLDNVLGMQERSLSFMNTLQAGSFQQYDPSKTGQIQQAGFQRIEIDTLLLQQNELVSNSRQIKNSIQQMANSPNQQPTSVQQASQYSAQLIQETRDGVNNLRREVANLNNKLINQLPQVSQSCPSCLSTFNFFVGILIHLSIFLVYNFWTNSNRENYKKFY